MNSQKKEAFNMKRIQLTLIALFAAVAGLVAQNAYEGVISYKISLDKTGNKVVLNGAADMSNLKLKSTQMIIVTPILRSEDGTSRVEFPSVVITGRNRTKALKREIAFSSALPQAKHAAQYIRRHNGKSEQFAFTGEHAYAPWMMDAKFVVREEVRGCAKCPVGLSSNIVPFDPLFNPAEAPYLLAHITPAEEVEKQRESSFDAYINFKVNKAEVLPEYRNNKAELEKIKEFVSTVKANPNYSVNKMIIEGFASPEASIAHNKALSERRAKRLAEELVRKYGKTLPNITTEFGGEDWKGLKLAIEKSDIADRDRVLEIINSDKYADDDAREQALKQLSSYRYILDQIYPNLRRNTITMGYIVRDYTLEEAREIIKTAPKELSEAEMYRVAMSYPEGHQERLFALNTTLKYFPESVTGRINLAVAAFNGGDVQQAIALLSPIQTEKGVSNILGAAYARTGDFARAETFFRKAVAEGDANAQRNLDMLLGKK